MTQGVRYYNTMSTVHLGNLKNSKTLYIGFAQCKLVWLKLFYGLSNVNISLTLII